MAEEATIYVSNEWYKVAWWALDTTMEPFRTWNQLSSDWRDFTVELVNGKIDEVWLDTFYGFSEINHGVYGLWHLRGISPQTDQRFLGLLFPQEYLIHRQSALASKPKPKHKCKCDFRLVVWVRGCQCGGV